MKNILNDVSGPNDAAVRKELERFAMIHGVRSTWRDDLVIVCDSLSPEILEACVRSRQTRDEREPSGEERSTLRGPTWIFVLESEQMPEDMMGAFPPDVQIQLGTRPSAAGVHQRTMTVQKARYQRVRTEEFPFTISATGHPSGISGACGDELPPPHEWHKRRPGITVFPALSAISTTAKADTGSGGGGVKFERACMAEAKIDGTLTAERELARGCTLVLTENGCHSTVLGLHFLLSQLLDGKLDKDVLYICADGDISAALYGIWQCKELQKALTGSGRSTWRDIEKSINNHEFGGPDELLYRIPLRKGDAEEPTGEPADEQRHLFVVCLQVDRQFPEEVLSDLAGQLDQRAPLPDGQTGPRRIGRVLFNRIGRVNSRWPLIEDADAFTSSLWRLCSSRDIDVMLIDDTADQSDGLGNVDSPRFALADNVIRLKRVAIRGTQTVAIQLLQAHGCEIIQRRPHELWYGVVSFGERFSSLAIRDTFRGYRGIFTDSPTQCRVRLDLPYDAARTPLRAEMETIKHNLDALLDDVQVRFQGLADRPGINTALAHLAGLTQDTCHIVALDEVWLSQLQRKEGPALGELGKDDLKRAWPEHVREFLVESLAWEENWRRDKGLRLDGMEKMNTVDYASEAYVTQALSASFKGEEVHAVPFFHNWGLLVASHLNIDIEALERAKKPEGLDDTNWQNAKLLLSSDGHGQKVAAALRGAKDTINLIKKAHEAGSMRIRAKDVGGSPVVATWADHETTCEASWHDLKEGRIQLSDALEQIAQEISRRIRDKDEKDEAIRKLRHCYPNGFHLNFFSFGYNAQESVVSFLLELLLTGTKKSDVFQTQQGVQETSKGPVYTFATSPEAVAAMVKAAKMMYELLTARQRRRIAHAHASVASLTANDESGPEEGASSVPDIPEINMFSRTWISNVPHTAPEDALVDHIVEKHLPVWGENGAGDSLYGSICAEPVSPVKYGELEEACRDKGVTVSGTWYLGALKGGNMDLAADVIGELVSEERELDRMRCGAGAPVFREFYKTLSTSEGALSGGDGSPAKKGQTNKDQPAEIEFSPLPYAKIVRLVNRIRDIIRDEARKEDGRSGPVEESFDVMFPFHRLRIKDYPNVSGELYDFVRHVMQIPDDTSDEGLESGIGRAAKASLARINREGV